MGGCMEKLTLKCGCMDRDIVGGSGEGMIGRTPDDG